MKKAAVRQSLLCRLGRGSHAEANRLMRELGWVRRAVVIKEGDRTITSPVQIGEKLLEFWSRVRKGGDKSLAEVREWLRHIVPSNWWRLGGVCRRNVGKEVVEEALGRLNGCSSPGWDGFPAKLFQSFPEVFVPRMMEVVSLVEGCQSRGKWRCVYTSRRATDGETWRGCDPSASRGVRCDGLPQFCWCRWNVW